jgi:hypothetical protein
MGVLPHGSQRLVHKSPRGMLYCRGSLQHAIQ